MFRKVLLIASLAIVAVWLTWSIFAGTFVPNGLPPLTHPTPKGASGSICVLDTSDATFNQDVLNAKQPVFVDFYATWCGPCQFMTPVVEHLSAEYATKVRFFRVDIDTNPQLAGRYQIDSIPAFKIFIGGKVVAETLGVTDEAVLREKIDRAISDFGGSNIR